MEHSLPQSFGSARPPSLRGSNAKSGTSEDRRQVPKEVSDILTNGQAEYRTATPEEDRQYKDRSSSYMRAEEDGIRIPGRDGLFKETQGLIKGYSNRLR